MKYLIILLLFASCSPLRHYQAVADDHQRDAKELKLLAEAASEAFPPSTVYMPGTETTVYRDSMVVIPGETLIDTVDIPCPIEYHSEIKGKNTSLKVIVSKGKGTIICKTDSLEKILDSVIQLKSRVDTVEHTDTVNSYLYKTTLKELETIKASEKRIGYITGLVFKWLINRWWFWVIVVGLGLYLTRKWWLRLTPVGKFISFIHAWLDK